VFDETGADENNTLRNVIREVQPAILTKGPDYENKKIVGEEFAEKVVICPMVPGKSTTIFVNKLKATHQ
jgi:bifunctional ADP-heptose synthase (sugar kinase/adenylyltransferase)